MRPVISPYEALTAKVRALYGKRLRFADFERMGNCSSEQEVLDILKSAPGWCTALEGLDSSVGFIGRAEMEDALNERFISEYRSLMYFIPQSDRSIMQFPVLQAERSAILRALRRLKAGPSYKGISHNSRFLLKSSIDDALISQCTDYDGLIAAAADSIYAPVLRTIRHDDGSLPEYMITELLLRTAYFTHMYRIIYHNYSGQTKAVLLSAFGKQIDLLNLIHILRLKTYFPDTQDVYKALFPFNYRLKSEFLSELCAAENAEAAFALVRRSAYAESFINVDVSEVEDYYRRAFYTFNRSQLLTGAPSVYTAMSYLNLKETEMRTVVNIIESVKYGVEYDVSFARLIGS